MHFKSIDYEMLLLVQLFRGGPSLKSRKQINIASTSSSPPVWQPHRPVFYLQHLGTTLLMYMKGFFNPYCSLWQSSEIRGLCLMKCSSETLQKFLELETYTVEL